MSHAREARERMGLAAIFSVDHAAELLGAAGMTRAEARDWLRDQGLIRHVDGKPVVRWSDVHERIGDLEAPRPAPIEGGLRRAGGL